MWRSSSGGSSTFSPRFSPGGGPGLPHARACPFRRSSRSLSWRSRRRQGSVRLSHQLLFQLQHLRGIIPWARTARSPWMRSSSSSLAPRGLF
ncbi:hypothetical protein GUJ93_ZPchr0011g28548 [Zizania palustris]|uniref:Uncharacterized protein n=1 Tax=Zizania palustris TaxID=103762 RepID=A0A8J5WLU7_ZIZPA|nr:hypothetical protein GUJ93_ZPchr0011g28548 [Zizania palustris]